MNKPDGGPAFPRPTSEDRRDGDQPEGNQTIHAQSGMSLRDYFAAKAISGLLGNSDYQASFSVDEDACEAVAQHGYKIADAMLAEREK